jgi:hypothetical protein
MRAIREVAEDQLVPGPGPRTLSKPADCQKESKSWTNFGTLTPISVYLVPLFRAVLSFRHPTTAQCLKGFEFPELSSIAHKFC